MQSPYPLIHQAKESRRGIGIIYCSRFLESFESFSNRNCGYRWTEVLRGWRCRRKGGGEEDSHLRSSRAGGGGGGHAVGGYGSCGGGNRLSSDGDGGDGAGGWLSQLMRLHEWETMVNNW